MSTLEMERGGDVLVRPPAHQTVPDHVPADVAAEHPDAASVVARRVERPLAIRVVDRVARRARAGLVLGLAVCAVAAAVGGGGDSRSLESVRVRATQPAVTTTVTSIVPISSSCPPPPFASPFSSCRPPSAGE